jgi:hypothetical protein
MVQQTQKETTDPTQIEVLQAKKKIHPPTASDSPPKMCLFFAKKSVWLYHCQAIILPNIEATFCIQYVSKLQIQK